jgi:hypothetical protein
VDRYCAARRAQLGRQGWEEGLETTASFSGANNNIPPPTSGLANLTPLFAAQGLSQKGHGRALWYDDHKHAAYNNLFQLHKNNHYYYLLDQTKLLVLIALLAS